MSRRRTAVDAVEEWLALDRHVLVRGDDGSGRTTVLEQVRSQAARRGVTAVLVPGACSAALRGDDVTPTTRDPAIARVVGREPRWSARLLDDLRQPGALLLVDDLDLVDEQTAGTLVLVVRRTRCRLVATTGLGSLLTAGEQLRVLLSSCAPAEVRLPPLGLAAVAALVSDRLGGDPDAGLVATVTACSAGNPQVAGALVDAGRFTGAVQLVDGVWHEVGDLGSLRVDAVAHALLLRLGAEEVQVLEAVAWAGPHDGARLATTFPTHVVDGLIERGRLVAYQRGPEPERLVVAPPALARTVRSRIGRRRACALGRLLADLPDVPDTGGSRADGGPGGHGSASLGERAFGDPGTGDGDGWWAAAELATVVHEHGVARTAALRAAWRREPSLRNANAFLRLLLQVPVPPDDVTAVLRGTTPHPGDTSDDRAVHEAARARWALACGEPISGRAPAWAELDRCYGEVLARVRRDPATREPPGDVPADGGVPPYLLAWSHVVRAAALVETGRPDLALTLCESTAGDELPPEVRHHLDGLRGEALLWLGRLREAEDWSRVLLVRACASVDLLAIRVHACVLAEVLICAGRPQAAWRALDTSLRLGPAGPAAQAFYRRSLALGAMLQARSGGVRVARVLVAALDASPPEYTPLIRSLRPLARAALQAARGRGTDLDARLWARGEQYARRGLRQPALLCWLLMSAPPSAQRLQRIRETFDDTHLPVLEPYVRLQEALATGRIERADDAVAHVVPELAPGLVRSAAELLEPGGRGRQPTAPAVAEVLSAREREVALLARDGLTNRQIAGELVLSVRTVENHMSRALRKLGIAARGDLRRWSEP